VNRSDRKASTAKEQEIKAPATVDPPRTVAVLRALQLGDLLCSVPALKTLRTAFPQAHVTLIGLPWATEFVRRFHHYVDEHVEFPGYPGLPERPCSIDAVPSFLTAMQRRRFDLVVQMHGSGQFVNEIAVLMGGRQTAGYFRPPGFCPDERLFLAYPEGLPEIQRHLRLMSHLRLSAAPPDLEFPIAVSDERALRALEPARGLQPGRYLCVHPGGRGDNRRWPPEQFALLADRLAKAGFTIVVTGTAQEREITRAMIRHMREPVIDLAGQTDLGTLAVLIRDARLLVANDTGVSHLAAALKTPSVIVCIGSDPDRWGPLDRTRHKVLSGSKATTDAVWAAIQMQVGHEGVASHLSSRRSGLPAFLPMTVNAMDA
jgi:ADP-heptose:LPS heptosyltransferase